MNSRTLTDFAGRKIVAWIGEEMALSEAFDDGRILWRHLSVPFMQFIQLDLMFGDGDVVSLLSQLDGGEGFYGIYSPSGDQHRLVEKSHIHGSVYRTRAVSELPIGEIDSFNAVTDESGNITDLYFEIGNKSIRIASGEVYEDWNHTFSITFIDESLLVQVTSSV